MHDTYISNWANVLLREGGLLLINSIKRDGIRQRKAAEEKLDY